jgi:16S rRNA G966 N2-methylase RsmD
MTRGLPALKRRVGGPARRAVDAVARAIFERGSFEDTSPSVRLEELGLDAPGRVRYEPSGWTYLYRGLRGQSIASSDVLIDLGSGMGRVVCQAARRPFGRVIGVEISEELSEVARRNVERNRTRFRCADVEIVVADVLDYELPDEVTHVYLYHPFSGEIFSAALATVTASLDRRPRRLVLMYANPVLEAEILATGRFRLIRRSRGLRRDLLKNEVAVYEGR